MGLSIFFFNIYSSTVGAIQRKRRLDRSSVVRLNLRLCEAPLNKFAADLFSRPELLGAISLFVRYKDSLTVIHYSADYSKLPTCGFVHFHQIYIFFK